MRGRQLFAVFRPVIRLGIGILHLCPRGLARALFTGIRHLPGRIGIGLRYILLKRLCKSCGECVAMFEGVFLTHLEHADIGSNVSIHPMCYIDAIGGLTIGDDVSIAHASTIMSSNHDFTSPGIDIRSASVIKSAVRIENDVWVGAGVRILAGCHIGSRTVIAAGAVVTRDVPSHSVSAGVPAKIIKSLPVSDQ